MSHERQRQSIARVLVLGEQFLCCILFCGFIMVGVFVHLPEKLEVQTFLLTEKEVRCIQVSFISIIHILIESFHSYKRRVEFKFDKLR